MQDVLRLQDVSYDYVTKAGVVHAVRGVSAVFQSDTIYAIVGRSGSGKSTLLSLCAGLGLPLSGTVFYRDRSLADMDRDRYRRENAGIIFQQFYLLPQLTALENVELTLDLIGYGKNKRSRAMELIERVGLTSFHAKKRPSQLSGGEQQRIAIARALAPDPDILFADEPTGSLDCENREMIIGLLASMAHEAGKCVIVITHDDEAAKKCDHVFRMTDGRIEAENTDGR